MLAMVNPQHNLMKAWVLAIRPKTLPAAAAPVVVGSALAYASERLQVGTALVCLLTALLLQVGSNLANDVFDYEKGADREGRLGPLRVTQAGLLAPGQVKRGMWFVFGLTAVLGLFLVWQGGWVIMVLGLAAILSAIAYTGGPYPLGYHGLGDIFVFVFFGLAATAGTYYLQTGVVSVQAWWMSVAMGFLTVNILVVNNLRDIASDRQVSKRTLVVRFGERAALTQYCLQTIGAYGILLMLWLKGLIQAWGLLPFVTIPVSVYWLGFISKNRGTTLNKALAGAGQLELLYGVLFAVGMALAGIG
jgi:1,4-dihydroxy-2-naphthoate octaprenyltransferase